MIAKPLIVVPAALLVGGAAVFGVATAAQSHETTQASPAPVTAQQAPATRRPRACTRGPAPASAPCTRREDLPHEQVRGPRSRNLVATTRTSTARPKPPQNRTTRWLSPSSGRFVFRISSAIGAFTRSAPTARSRQHQGSEASPARRNPQFSQH